MAFCREMDDCVRPVFGEQAGYERSIEDRAADQCVGWIPFERGKIFYISRIGKRIKINHSMTSPHTIENKVRADEPGTSRHQ
jgi:hypothetical protein